MKRLEIKLYQILLRSDGVLKEMVNRKLGNALLMKKWVSSPNWFRIFIAIRHGRAEAKADFESNSGMFVQ